MLGLNEDGSFLDDSFPLELNGQGYFLITNDGTDLYLQSRTTQLIFKSSTMGNYHMLNMIQLALIGCQVEWHIIHLMIPRIPCIEIKILINSID